MTETVFIIDDDASVRRSMSRLLRSEGIATESFESASAYLERNGYDGVGCILLDINMPEMSGIELQARLAERGDVLPVVFLTGHGNTFDSPFIPFPLSYSISTPFLFPSRSITFCFYHFALSLLACFVSSRLFPFPCWLKMAPHLSHSVLFFVFMDLRWRVKGSISFG